MAEIQTYPSGTPVAGDKVPFVSDPTGSPALKLADAASLTGWTKVVDEPGDSLTNFTSLGSGTWATDGTSINLTSPGTPSNLFYSANTMSMMSFVVEADVLLASSTAGDCYAGVGVLQSTGSGAVPWHGYGPFVRIQRVGGTFQALAGRVSHDQSVAPLVGGAMDTWFTLRMVLLGGAGDMYVNGTRTTATRGTGEFQADTLTLWAYTADAKWRNIKAWTANTALPS